jgi:WD40 repeat protein
VLLAVRADFMGQMLSHRGLADALQGGVIMLGPMNRQELEDAIVKPAQAQGVRLQDGLAARILRDVGQAPGRLPLLEFALTQLWTRQVNGVLTHEAYETIGQVEGALADYAEGVYALLNASEQNDVRRLLTQMVQLGQDTEDSRRPLTAAEVSEEDWALVQRLADQRLLVTDIDARGQQTAEIVHETLIHGWGRLRQWLDADRAFHLWQQRARLAADQWQKSGRDSGALLRGAPLAEAEGWSAARGGDIGQRVGELIAASQTWRQQEDAELTARQQESLAQAKALADAEHQRAEVERRSNRRLRWFAASLSLVALLAILAGALAVTQRTEAERQSVLAQAAQATANAERRQAEQEALLARARQLGAQSLNLVTTPDLSILLALYALRMNDNAGEDSALLLDFAISPLLGTVLHDQSSSVYSFAVSPDSRLLASGGENGVIWLWDLNSRRLLAPPLRGHEQTVQSLAFSPDGTRLASGDRDGAIRLWTIPDGRPLGDPIPSDTVAVTALSFSPDGKSLYSTSDNGTQKTWNVETAEAVSDATALAGLNGMAFNADGSLVVARDGFTLTVQSTLDGQPVSLPMLGHSASIHDVVFSPDSRLLASAGFDGIINVWDLTTSQPLYQPLEGHDGRVLAVAWSPDGRVLASGGTDSQIILWDVATGTRIGPPLLGHGNWVRTLAWTPDGSTLVSGDAAGKVDLWAMGNLRLLPGHTAAVRGVDFSPDGSTLASGSFDQTVILHDVASGQQALSPMQDHDNAVLNVAYSPDGRMLVSASAGGDLVRWDAGTGKPLGEPLTGHTGPVAGLAISPDGRIIASGSFDNTIRLWDAASGQPLGEPLTGHSNWIISLAFSPDGRTLASGSSDTTIRLWDAATGAAIGEPLQGHTGWVTDLAWSLDGVTLISGSLDKTVRFWDAAAGQPDGEPLTGHEAGVWSVMLNPADGGRTLYTGDNSGTVIWWEVAGRHALAPPLRTAIETESLALSPDGHTVAIASFGSDGLASLWRLPSGPWDEGACAIANRNLTHAERDYYFGDFDYEAICNPPAAD